MADDLEAVKNSLDILSQVFQVVTTFSDVSRIITASGPLAAAFPILGAILGLIGGFLPDVKHMEIIGRFNQLDNKIDRLRYYMKDLNDVIRLDISELEYSKDLEYIELGMQNCLEIGKRSGEDERKVYQDKLKELCANEKCALALTNILDGMTGNGILRSGSILDKFYDNIIIGGNRQRISALGTQLVQLLSGGIMVISTYETMIHGKKGAADITKSYYRRLNEASDKVKSVLDRCVKDFNQNMENDINKKLDEGGSNKYLAADICTFMRDKYDWLETYCVVYNDLRGFTNHYAYGDRVWNIHRNGKCGIVYYRTKGEAPQSPNRYYEAIKIVKSSYCTKAIDCYNDIEAKLKARGIQKTGLAVIKGNPDICTAGYFSTMVIFVDKPHSRKGIFAKAQKGKVILLLK